MKVDQCYYCKGESFSVEAFNDEIRFNCYNTVKYVAKCNKCGLIQLLPQWEDGELDKIYKDYNKQKDFIGQKDISKRESPYLLKYIHYGDSVLEVGCGRGDNVNMLRRNERTRVHGIDKDPSVSNGYTITTHDYKDFLPIKNAFNKIYAIHLFEHLKDPVDFLTKCLDSLRRDGQLILEFPNVDDPLLTLWKIPEFKSFYYRPDHHFFYTPFTLWFGQLKEKYDIRFKLKLIQNYGIINHLNWFFRRKPTNIKYNIPIIDAIYKFILTKIYKKSDTMLLIITKES